MLSILTKISATRNNHQQKLYYNNYGVLHEDEEDNHAFHKHPMHRYPPYYFSHKYFGDSFDDYQFMNESKDNHIFIHNAKMIITIIVLIFGLIGDIIAWIFAASKIAIIWNFIYLILIVIGFIGLGIDEPYLLIAPLIGFIIDILIAIGGLYIILSGQDITIITGNSVGSLLWNTDSDKGARMLFCIFLFYIITQPLAIGLLVYVILN